ncbi:hypothetical protein QR46_4365 [Giardia duodenalis assemblage B]|uniref:Protein 21.1 n=1 Tax=Giardia duodenalis assemblage B TaxID=1394984 RepID=A0A132NNJ1_GIAIN|nr:hypothetical protein QR46_4365 [Giardia intestinalis assemblage B]
MAAHEHGLTDGNGWTALMHAAYLGHAECAGLLVTEMSIVTPDGKTALRIANERGHDAVVAALNGEVLRETHYETRTICAVL